MSEMLQFPAGRITSAASAGSILTCENHDNTIRWRPGERLHHLFERRTATLTAAGHANHPALEVGGVEISFEQLDRRANQMAQYLRTRGLTAGDRVGLIVDRSVTAYVVLLAVLKIDAAYVPLDPKFPADRIAFIAADAGVKAFIVTPETRRLVDALELPVIDLPEATEAAAAFADERIEPVFSAQPDDRLCYIIYTSGSTGRPKGVAVNHSSICNFVQVATEVYGYRPSDRVYQGMTLAFDFSVEELWVPLMSGATLVPSPTDRQLMGSDLARFLADRRITAMCCVPTLLATIDEDLPELRLLLVSGEACPQDIVSRWQRPGRRMLNAYGPTEATVTATWTELQPEKAVTIGVPLPTYTIAILETERNALAGDDAVGEIAIAGIGLAEGYVNRPDLTDKAFVPDFLQLASNPSRRLYRTGDLGRINNDGEIEYLGRIDTQVKIRGYRIELAEIENVLLEIDGIAQAVVTPHEAEPGLKELAAYVTYFGVQDERPDHQQILSVLRSRLPGYMVPAYIEELDKMPLLASHKADRKALPPPSGMRLVSRTRNFVAPGSDTEKTLARCLADILKLDAISINDHFFDDLGAHSLLMGQFLTAFNTTMPSAKASIADVYLTPTIAQLAAEIDARIKSSAQTTTAPKSAPRPAHVASDFDYALCGVMQGVFYLVSYALSVGLAVAGVVWTSMASSAGATLGRALAFTLVTLALTMALPIVAKWTLIGRWKPGHIPIWSLSYVRFWIVRQLINVSPWRAFQGTALFNVYLRLLGAKIGHGALILTRSIPVISDLLAIGDHTVVRKNVFLSGYKAERGYIEMDHINIGSDVLVGDLSVVDVGTKIGDDGQLGHASALLTGQSIPPGKRYHGVPARETDTQFRRFKDEPSLMAQRTLFAAMRLALVVVASTIALALAANAVQWGNSETATVAASMAITWAGAAWVVAASLIAFIGFYLLAMAGHLVVPRLARRLLEQDRFYPIYGFHHYVAGVVSGIGYSPIFQSLFGDSSGIVHYLKWAGVRQPDAVQTGSNFGTAMAYESPFELEFGRGAMISDGFSIINFETGSGCFKLVPARVGRDSFVGNSMVYPAGARIGDNCLLGTKVMVPIDGEMRENIGLLGSPAFEIPRETVNGQRFNTVPSTPEEKARLTAKNHFNFRTALLHLGSQWTLLAGFALIGYLCSALFGTLGWWSVGVAAALAPIYGLLHGVIVERWSTAGIKFEPHNCTIHQPYFWWIERHWKLGETLLKHAMPGTPFRPMILRLLGLKVGAKLFEDGSVIPEKPLVEIGDNVCINAGCSIQGHSLEDGLFKSDRIKIGSGCTIGAAGFVHYGVTMGENTILGADAFLMKGATTSPGSVWQGNPARPV